MRRSSWLQIACSLVVPLFAGCLSTPTPLGDGGVDSMVATTDGMQPAVGREAGPAESGAAEKIAEAAVIDSIARTDMQDEDAVPPYITYRDDLSKHPGCSTAGITTRVLPDTTPASYTPAVINGGAFKCCAKEYPVPANEDTTKPIIVLVHGNSSTPNDWEAYVNDTSKAPMISETLLADGYHVYASDVRFDLVPTDTTNNPAKNYDHGWAEPIVESLLTNLFAQYPPPRMFNIAGFSIGPTVIRDTLRRMLRKGLNPFARIHALHYASGGNHGVSSYSADCGSETSPLNTTMAGLAACQLGNRSQYQVTPFEQPLNGGQMDLASFDTPCADGTTAYGQTGVCGGNKVVYTTVVFKDQPDGSQLDEFVSQASSELLGANNLTVTEPEPGICMGTGTSMCTGYFYYPNFEHHYGAIRSPQGIAIAKAALETP